MILAEQVQSILFHVLMGWMYGCTFSFLEYLLKYRKSRFFKGCSEIIFHVAFTLMMFQGLFYINGGITNFYLIGFFGLGILIYYHFYFTLFMHLFYKSKMVVYPFFHMLAIAKKKLIGIMKIPVKKWKRRKRRGRKKNAKRSKGSKEKAPSA